MSDRVTEILAERPSTHGDFTVGANFTQSVEGLARSMPGHKVMNEVQREGFHMIVHKLQRICAGDPNHKDHWDDIAGYAKLVSDRIK